MPSPQHDQGALEKPRNGQNTSAGPEGTFRNTMDASVPDTDPPSNAPDAAFALTWSRAHHVAKIMLDARNQTIR